MQIISDYYSYKKDILSQFSNKKIKESYKKFNDSFDALYNFLIEHFWIPDVHYKMYKNPPFLYLNPDIHHNFGGSNKNSKLWNNYKKKLDEIAESFEGEYKNFIEIANKEIKKGKLKGSKWWENTWVQVIFILGVIASFLGLIIPLIKK